MNSLRSMVLKSIPTDTQFVQKFREFALKSREEDDLSGCLIEEFVGEEYYELPENVQDDMIKWLKENVTVTVTTTITFKIQEDD